MTLHDFGSCQSNLQTSGGTEHHKIVDKQLQVLFRESSESKAMSSAYIAHDQSNTQARDFQEAFRQPVPDVEA
jgi:hypothetical protein